MRGAYLSLSSKCGHCPSSLPLLLCRSSATHARKWWEVRNPLDTRSRGKEKTRGQGHNLLLAAAVRLCFSLFLFRFSSLSLSLGRPSIVGGLGLSRTFKTCRKTHTTQRRGRKKEGKDKGEESMTHNTDTHTHTHTHTRTLKIIGGYLRPLVRLTVYHTDAHFFLALSHSLLPFSFPIQ